MEQQPRGRERGVKVNETASVETTQRDRGGRRAEEELQLFRLFPSLSSECGTRNGNESEVFRGVRASYIFHLHCKQTGKEEPSFGVRAELDFSFPPSCPLPPGPTRALPYENFEQRGSTDKSRKRRRGLTDRSQHLRSKIDFKLPRELWEIMVTLSSLSFLVFAGVTRATGRGNLGLEVGKLRSFG